MINNKIFTILAITLLSVFLVSSASALIISSVDSDTIAPGQEGNVKITIKNNLDYDIEDVSFALDFSSALLPLSSKGSSEETISDISEDDKESVTFTIRADSSAKVGDYKVPFTITYLTSNNSIKVQTGTIGVRVSASPNLDFSASVDSPVIGEKTKLSLKLLNKGLGEAKFVSISLTPEGYTLLSDNSEFISSIDSNDFDTASFDIILKSKSATLSGTVEYRDLDNKVYTESINLSLTVYSKDEAIKNGIITKSNTSFYVLLILILLVIWFIWRAIKKRNRLKKSREAMSDRSN
ncbi:MAG: hypothetical protein AABX11_04155 [Nanoarchaeota archaeon]